MAKSRRMSRKGSRKSRKGSRKSRTRRGGAAKGFFGTVYSPIGHLLGATENAVGTVTGTVNTVAKSGIRGVNRIGRSVTGHANLAVRNLIGRRRKSRKANRK